MKAGWYERLKDWNPTAASALLWLSGTAIGLLILAPISAAVGRPLTGQFVVCYFMGGGGLLTLMLIGSINRRRRPGP